MAKKKVTGTIYSIGLANGMLGINDIPAGMSYLVKATDAQKDKLFPRLKIGMTVEVWFDEETQKLSGGIKILDEPTILPAETPVSKQEMKVETEISREKAIVWQTCIKAAVELEKLFVGELQDRDETVKHVLKMANNLFEGTMRKFRGLPPFPEARDE